MVAQSTIDALVCAHEGKTWRDTADCLGFGDRSGFHAILHAMVHKGHGSIEIENEVRRALGLEELTRFGNEPTNEKRHRWSATVEHEDLRQQSDLTSTEFIERLIEFARRDAMRVVRKHVTDPALLERIEKEMNTWLPFS